MKTGFEQTVVRPWKVLLVSANRCTTPEPVFPLGLAHLSAALRQAGHEVRCLDLLMAEHALAEDLRADRPGIAGVSVRNIDDVLSSRRESFVDGLAALVERIHQEAACPVVLGGSGFSILPRELLESSGADFGIVGEGEAAFPALLEALDRNGGFEGIPGLAFRKNGETVINAPSRFSGQGLELPADFPETIASKYLKRGGILNVQTQRGCAHRCCYCTYPVIEGTRHRNRSAEAVVAEFEQLERLGARYAFVVDSVFNSSEDHVSAVCEQLARRPLRIRWGCFLRPQGLSREMVRLMAQAGLAHVEFGSDSFCDKVLAAYQKEFTFEDIRQSTELVRNENIDFCHFAIAGGPGETRDTLEEGFKNSQALRDAIIMAVPGMRIYPGTRLFERAVAEGRIAREVNLLKPAYYFAPGLDLDRVMEQLRNFASLSPNWIAGEFDPDYEGLVARLRQRGVTGPLWSYFSTAQRLWPRAKRGGSARHHNGPYS